MTRPPIIDSRPSISSNRSQRKEVDFEAALLNPSQTLFISSSPNLDDDQPVFPSREADAPDPAQKRSFEEDYNHPDLTPVRGADSPAVIPPTPSTPGASGSRRDSLASTSVSTDSPARRLSRLKPLKAVGMDEEAAMDDANSSHKRSIFRSPGTASSPDLATLVRLAKEAKGKPASPKSANKPSTSRTEARSRAASRASQPEWDAASHQGEVRSVSSGYSGNRMTTISEASKAKPSDDGFKSVRNKAKGMFGRMFGSKDQTNTLPSRGPVSHNRPPVPPIPQSYAREADERRRALSRDTPKPADVFGQVQPTVIANGSRTLPVEANDKPLPAIQKSDTSLPEQNSQEPTPTILSPAATHRGTRHSRQPASDAFDQEEKLPLTTPQKALASFSEDVNGMFSGIGETHLANELGLPPDSLRVKSQTKPALSALPDEPGRFPAELSRAAIKDRQAPVPSRTTSLPATPTLAVASTNRMPSSPHPPRPKTPISRSSSTMSSQKPPPLAPPLDDFGPTVSTTAADQDITWKPKQREISGSTVMGSTFSSPSVRLVGTARGTPRPTSIHTSSVNGDWGHSPPSAEQTEDTIEMVTTPGPEEDEEEKGRRIACELLEDDFKSVPYDKVAMFLGGPRNVNRIALGYYMQYFDSTSQNLVDAFRDLCKKLHLKAESQEIDRIIEAFSARYFECNPTTVFGTAGVVHTVTGAMLMLNTDLHIADLSKHMSRTDFVRNSMRAVQESMPAPDADSTADLVHGDGSSGNMSTTHGSVGSIPGSIRERRPPNAPSTHRSASAPVMGQYGNTANNRESCAPVGPFSYGRAWEQEAETALKDIYANVKADRILLPTGGLSGEFVPNHKRQSVMSMSGLSDRNRGAIRSPSGSRVNALKRGSIIGSQSLLGQPFMSDGRLSPTPSYATSIDETIAQSFAPSFGFASNLTQSVIKEHEDEVRSNDSALSSDTQDEMDDDELALLGPPWAKEGNLQSRLYWESVGKKAKKKDWRKVFVVVQKGELSMFTFEGTKSGNFGGSVGGGNWTSTANSVGAMSLLHAVASGLPKPGYNNSRPHCMSLTLPGGEGWFFQAGTEDLVAEWVQTCNYWAARISRQPLQGGVSNMEYGWSRALGTAGDDDDKSSIKSSRSSLSKFTGTYGRRGSAPADKIYINDWRPPPPATMPSPLDEENQLEALASYVKRLESEHEQHQAIEEPMTRLYTPGSKNLTKARENWKAKSYWLHTEIHKYKTYLEALRSAIALRVKKQGEKKLDRSLRRSVGSLHLLNEREMEDDGAEDGRVTPTAAR